jgi:HEAT repeat protein
MTEHKATLGLTSREQDRLARIRELSEGGAAHLEELLSSLDDPSWTVRREVIASLGLIGEPAATRLCGLVRNDRGNETKLAAAVDALVASTADVLSLMASLADDPNPAVVADAAQVLGRRRMGRATPLLARLASHSDDNVAVSAVEALGRVGGRAAVDTLIRAVQSANFFRVFPAIDVLGRSGDPRAIAPLSGLLRDPTYTLEAARALGRTGELGAVGPLSSLLTHATDNTVRVALVALADLRRHHLERYGDDEGFARALLHACQSSPAVRRISQALVNADTGEKAAAASLLGVLGGDGAIAALRSLLDAPQPAADAAAASLKQLGRATDEQVREALREGSSMRRAILLPIVTRAASEPELVMCLSDPDPSVRALACDAIARVGAVNAVAHLMPLLADSNARVVQGAIGAIQSLGTDGALELAMQAAGAANPTVRRSALRILAYFGIDRAVPVFLQALKDTDPRVQDAAVAGLPFLNDAQAMEALLGEARSPLERVRGTAMRALGHATRKDARVAAYLLGGLNDPAPWVRYYACQALGRLGLQSAAEPVARLLQDPAGQVRVAAVEALAHIQGELALEALTRAAEGEEPDVRRSALIGLGISRRPEAIAILQRAAKSNDAATRLVAISALADASSPHAIPVLARAARDADANVRAAAIGFLAGAPGPEATAVLGDLLSGPDSQRVLDALVVPAEGRVAGIRATLESADDELAPLLTAALVRIRTPEAFVALLQVLGSAGSPGRKAAAAGIGSFGSPEAIDALKIAADTDPDPEVRQVCAAVLTR